MNESMNRSDILQEIKKSLNFIYGIRCDYINDELLKMERCKGKLPLIVTIKRVIFNAPATIVFWLIHTSMSLIHRILAGRLENRGEGPERRTL